MTVQNNKRGRGRQPYVPTAEIIAMVERHNQIKDTFDDFSKRRSLGLIYQAAGPRSVAYIARETGSHFYTIRKGLVELSDPEFYVRQRRKPGRKKSVQTELSGEENS